MNKLCLIMNKKAYKEAFITDLKVFIKFRSTCDDYFTQEALAIQLEKLVARDPKVDCGIVSVDCVPFPKIFMY